MIVTGGGGGMGSAATELLAARGVNVLCADRNDDALAETAAKVAGLAGRVATMAVDIGDPDAVQGMIERALAEWGGFDGVFNIAGFEGTLAPIVDTTIDEFDEVLRSNIRGTWLSMKYALPHLVERGGGVIVNTGSYQALHGKANCAAYSGAKHAIVGMTKSIALEYATQERARERRLPGRDGHADDQDDVRTSGARRSREGRARGRRRHPAGAHGRARRSWRRSGSGCCSTLPRTSPDR